VRCKITIAALATTKTTTTTISKSFRHYLRNIPEKQEIKELQKETILGTAHILRKSAEVKCKTYLTREITLHVAKIVNTERLQHYTP